MIENSLLPTDILAYALIGLCGFMVLFGLIRMVKVCSMLRMRDHQSMDFYTIYSGFKKDAKGHARQLDEQSGNLVMQEIYLTQHTSSDRRYIH